MADHRHEHHRVRLCLFTVLPLLLLACLQLTFNLTLVESRTGGKFSRHRSGFIFQYKREALKAAGEIPLLWSSGTTREVDLWDAALCLRATGKVIKRRMK